LAPEASSFLFSAGPSNYRRAEYDSKLGADHGNVGPVLGTATSAKEIDTDHPEIAEIGLPSDVYPDGLLKRESKLAESHHTSI
jgi:hypothetical protein